MSDKQRAGTIISVGGGKGGVGKSILSIGLGTVLARSGKSVVLADLDLGAANLHTYIPTSAYWGERRRSRILS